MVVVTGAMFPNRAPYTIPSETLLSALAEPDRLAVYLSPGIGPLPRRSTPEQPEFVRLAVLTGAPLAAVQAAGEAWVASATRLGLGPVTAIDVEELVAPPPGSPWAPAPAEARAELLRVGVEQLLGLQPEVAVFQINDEFGADLLARVQAELAAGEGWLDVYTLENLVFATLTYRLLVHPGEAVVVTAAQRPTWSM